MAVDSLNSLTSSQATARAKELGGAMRLQKTERVDEVEKPKLPDQQAKVAEEKQLRERTVDPESLNKLIQEMNDQPQIKRRALQFSMHEETGQMLVKVYDLDTDELIREFPPEEILNIAERIHDLLAEKGKGIMLQDQA